MTIKTHRLLITELDPSMAESLHMLSLDEDTRRYLPDEVFETVDEALETIGYLLACRESGLGPQVLAVTLGSELVGYVQASPIPEGWEIGYHIGGAFTGRGYATEAVRAFLQVMLPALGIDRIYGVCLAENRASLRVLEKCGFETISEGLGVYQGKERPIRSCIYRI